MTLLLLLQLMDMNAAMLVSAVAVFFMVMESALDITDEL